MFKKFMLLSVLLLSVPSLSQAAGIEAIAAKIQAKYATYQDKMRNMVITKEMVMSQRGMDMKMQTKTMIKGEKSRIEQTMDMPQMGAMTTIIINDGQNIWSINPMMGKMMLPKNQADQQPRDYGTWWNYLEGAQLLGEEQLNRRDCYVIQPSPDSKLSFEKIWLDKSTLGMVQAIKGQLRISNSDFRNVGGIDLPHTIEIYNGDQLMGTGHVLSYEFGVNLPDELFNPDLVPGAEQGGGQMQGMLQKILQAQNKQQ